MFKKDASKLFIKFVSEIFTKYAPEMFTKYASEMLTKYAPDMLTKCTSDMFSIEAIDTIDAFPIDAFKNVCLVKYDKNVTILLSHSVLTAGSIDRRSLCDVFFLFKKSIYKKYLLENTLASY